MLLFSQAGVGGFVHQVQYRYTLQCCSGTLVLNWQRPTEGQDSILSNESCSEAYFHGHILND